MKITIYGAGAIGCILAAKYQQVGHEVSVIARGETLKSIQDKGVGLKMGEETRFYPVQVASKLSDLPAQDVIVVSVKQTAFSQIASDIAASLAPHTKVVLAMNGVPWWFLNGLLDDPVAEILETVDPSKDLSKLIPIGQVVGCVVHLSSLILEPGLAHLRMGNRFIFGEPGGTNSQVTQQLSDDLVKVGFDSCISENIRQEIWFKLWGNMTMNPISALTRATSDKVLDDQLLHKFLCDVMTEANEVGTKIGIPIDQTPQDRNVETRKLGAMKTSMLQDVENGNALEYEALVGAAYEMAQKLDVSCPNLSVLYGLIRMLDKSLQAS